MIKNLSRLLVTSALLLTFSSQSRAELNVVASVRPIHALVAAVMGEKGKPDLLMEGSESPHSYSLKPSKAALLQSADVIFWIGPEFETFLTKPLEAIASQSVGMALMENDELTKLEYREGDFGDHDHDAHDDDHEEHGHDDKHEEHHDDDKDDAHEHDKHEDHNKEEDHAHEKHEDHDEDEAHGSDEKHEGHDDHGSIDSHIWLDPKNARIMVLAIADTLAKADAQNTEIYMANAKATIAKIETQAASIKSSLKSLHDEKFLTFHDAYHYFERAYDLQSVGAITLNPDVPISAARLSELRTQLKQSGATCIFSEPQFDSKLIGIVIEGTDVQKGVLDPIGISFEPGRELYFNMIEGLAESFKNCLSKK